MVGWHPGAPKRARERPQLPVVFPRARTYEFRNWATSIPMWAHTGGNVVVVSDVSQLSLQAIHSLRASTRLAMDCEGVKLCREGEICLVQLASPEGICFLFDVDKKVRTQGVIELLKELLESPNIIKVVHSCGMDSDALWYLLGIRLTAVHDTQAWDDVISGSTVKNNLNNTLLSFGCAPNPVRNSDAYRINNAFWATRPLQPWMIEWASGDVHSLLELQEKQCLALAWDKHQRYNCEQASNNNADSCCRVTGKVIIRADSIGQLIGPGGSNLRQLEKSTGSFFQGLHSGDFLVYAKDQQALEATIQDLSPYC
eukprot:gene5040-34829_t